MAKTKAMRMGEKRVMQMEFHLALKMVQMRALR
jgi:hypothetical protein